LDVAVGNDNAIRIRNENGSNTNGLSLAVGSGSPWMDITEGREFRIKHTPYANIGDWNNGSNARFVIDPNGNIGINTTGPAAKLHVVDGNNSAKLGDLYGNSTMAFEMYDNAANPVGIEAYSDKMAWRMTGVHRMWLDQGGNLYPASPNVSDLGTSGTWWDQSYIRTINYNSEWYNYASGNIPSDSNWHQIFTGLNGHHVFDIRVQMSDSGVHTSGVIRVCVTFASGAVHAETSGSGYSGNIEARITGSTYSYNIELRHTTTSGSNPIYWRAKRINS